jgi:hypothetical protein
MDWSSPLQLDSGSPSQFTHGSGIDCVGESFCAATGGEGKIVVSTDPIGGSAAWKEVAIEEASAGNLTAVSCPSTSFCAAVDDAGHLLTASEPEGDAAVWASAAIDAGHEITSISCPSAGFCAAVDDASQVLVSDEPDGGAAAWSASTVVTGEPIRISCASTSLCALAFDGSRQLHEPPGLLVSTDPLSGAGSWADAGLDLGEGGGDVFGVSCPSDDFCGFAYDGGIFVSGDPAGGGSTWHLTHSSSEGLPAGGKQTYWQGLGITCSSANFCVAQLTYPPNSSYGHSFPKLLISSRPASEGSWTRQTLEQESDFGRAGMVCTGPTFCATLSKWGLVSTSTEPAGGSGAWDLALAEPMRPTLTSVACPAQAFCAATGTQGRLYTSTDPTDPGSWTATRLAEYIESVTCSSPAWCTLAADGPAGHTIMYATQPAAGVDAWSAVARPIGRALTCPEAGFCAQLAGDDEVLASDDPIGGGAGSWVTTDMRLPEERLNLAFLRVLSCPSAGLCAMGGNSEGNVLISTDPTGGRSGWIEVGIRGPQPDPPYPVNLNPAVAGIDCPQVSFCAVTGDAGVKTTTAPIGGPSAWTYSQVAAPGFLGPISCAEDASLCVLIESDGNAIASRLPEKEVKNWGIAEPIYEGEGLHAISCASDGSLCAVISDDGKVIVGTQRHRTLPISIFGALLGGGGLVPAAGAQQLPHAVAPSRPAQRRHKHRNKDQKATERGRGRHG